MKKRARFKMLTGAKRGSPLVPPNAKLKLRLKDGKDKNS